MQIKNQIKNTCINITLLVISLLFILVLTEIGLRIFMHQKNWNTTIWINHRILGYTHRPNFSFCRSSKVDQYSNCFKTDKNGIIIRNQDSLLDKTSKNGTTIMILGDSMLQGTQVPAQKNLSVHLENIMTESLKKKINVINLGRNGYSPILYLLSFRCYRKQFDPQLVITFITVGNDFNDDARFFHDNRVVYTEKGEIKALKPKFDYANRVYWTKSSGIIKVPWENSRFASFRIIEILKNALNRPNSNQRKNNIIRKFKIKSDLKPDCKDLSGNLTQRCYNYASCENSLIRNNLFSVLKKKYTTHDQEDIQRTLGYLNHLKNEVEEEKKRFLLVILPMAGQIPNQWEIGKRSFGFNLKKEESISSRIPQKIITEFCVEKDIPFLDLLPYFVKNSHQKMFWPRDTHLTETGHTLAAEAVAHWLNKNHIFCGTVKSEKNKNH